MASTIGLNSSAGLFGATMLANSEHIIISGPTYSGVLPAGEQWTEIGFVDRPTAGDVMEVGIYDITAGVSGATLIASENITTAGNTGSQIVVPITAVGTSGNTYAVACRPVGGDCTVYRNIVSGESRESNLTGATPLASSFTDAGVGNEFILGIFANSAITGASVSPPPSISDGSSSLSYNPAGFSGPISSVTLDSQSVPSFNQTTFDNFDIAGVLDDLGTIGARTGLVVFEATDGSDTASEVIDNQPQAGNAAVTMGTLDTVTQQNLYNQMFTQLAITLSTGDQFYYPNADGSTISIDSNFNILTLPFSFFWYELSTSKWYPITMSTNSVLQMNLSESVSVNDSIVSALDSGFNGVITATITITPV